MIDNNKFIPKIPEIKTEMMLSHRQPRQQEKKSTAEKLVESVKQASETAKEIVISTFYAEPDSDEVVKRVVGKTADLVFFYVQPTSTIRSISNWKCSKYRNGTIQQEARLSGLEGPKKTIEG